MLLVNEDTRNTTVAVNPVFAYFDAAAKGKAALNTHKDFFESDEHLDRLDQVSYIIESFFGSKPNYFTPRGLGRNSKNPFEAVKIEHVGRVLSRTKAEVKNARLYAPLLGLGNVEVISKNGHLTVRVYKKQG